MKTIIFVVLILLGVSGFVGADEWESLDVGKIHLKWMTSSLNLHIKVSAKTSGWIAVGFNPSDKMKDANIIIGYVKDGQVTIEDHFGSGRFSHRNDLLLGGTDDVSSKTGTEVAGVTRLSFTIPLDSGDHNDQVLKKGQVCKLIVASSTKDNFSAKHNWKSSINITLR